MSWEGEEHHRLLREILQELKLVRQELRQSNHLLHGIKHCVCQQKPKAESATLTLVSN
jgi:hypothetical protein